MWSYEKVYLLIIKIIVYQLIVQNVICLVFKNYWNLEQRFGNINFVNWNKSIVFFKFILGNNDMDLDSIWDLVNR